MIPTQIIRHHKVKGTNYSTAWIETEKK